MLNFNPKNIEKIEDEALRITWADGHVSLYGFPLLRRNCPCALCRDEWSGKALLDPSSVPDGLRADRADLVGHYALSFSFSDGHGAGIYSFETLRRLCACPECSRHPGSEMS